MRKLISAYSLCILIALGCTTPAGKIPESDFVWEDRIVKSNYQDVYRRIANGFRTCKPGIAEGNLYTDIKEGHFDVYLVAVFGGKHPGVLGIIRVKEDNNENTIVRVGVQRIYDNPVFGARGTYRKKWLKFAEGDLSCD